jgi:hypothetical protein
MRGRSHSLGGPMKKAAVLIAGILFCATMQKLHAQDNGTMPPEQKAWMEYMTPGPMHEMLKEGEGKWKVSTTYWMAPGAPPQTSEGESTSKMILGGRYLQTEIHAIFMGGPYDGMGIDAYDNALGEFRSIWMDNMGTGVMIMHGTIDPQTKIISYAGKVVDAVSKKEADCWTTLTRDGADHQTMEMFSLVDGKKFKTMEMKYDRVK